MTTFEPEPASYIEGWTIIRRLIKTWHQVTLDWNDEDAGPVISKIENTVGAKLPPSLKEWVRFLEKMKETDQWIFRDCCDFSFNAGQERVTLLVQGEADYFWAVKKKDLALADPPVEGYQLDYESDKGIFSWNRTETNKLTSFGIKYILDYCYMFLGTGGFSAVVPDREIVVSDFMPVFEKGLRIEDYTIFESDGIIAFFTSTQAPEARLHVHYSMSLDQVPQCVKRYFRHRYSYYGVHP